MPAAVEPPYVLVGHVGNHFTKLVIGAKKVLAHVSTIIGPVFLILAINRLFHALAQNALGVASQQRIPIGAPDHLDDIPTGAAEKPFKLLNDLAVAAHRTVEARRLQLTTKTRLSRCSRPASEMAPSDSGSSISPSPRKPHTVRLPASDMPRWVMYLRKRAW